MKRCATAVGGPGPNEDRLECTDCYERFSCIDAVNPHKITAHEDYTMYACARDDCTHIARDHSKYP